MEKENKTALTKEEIAERNEVVNDILEMVYNDANAHFRETIKGTELEEQSLPTDPKIERVL